MVRQIRLLYDARLIRDNCILAVPSAVISVSGGVQKKDTAETVVSTFGVLVGNKVYKWGCDGTGDIRLRDIEIDRERICLTFGNQTKILKLELLHGLADEAALFDVKHKLQERFHRCWARSGWRFKYTPF